MKKDNEKPEGWEETLGDLIRAKFNYENCNTALKKKFGEPGAIGGDVYRAYKAKIDGGAKVDEKLDEMRKQKHIKKSKGKPAWNKQKQSASDNSKLAEIINMGLYQGMFPLCATQQLTQEHIQEVNPGGAIVATINYYFPEAKLEHPLITLGIRIVILYIKFKSICGSLKKPLKRELQYEGAPKPGGLKPGKMTEHRS